MHWTDMLIVGAVALGCLYHVARVSRLQHAIRILVRREQGIRGMHQQSGSFAHCDYDGETWPCLTVRRLREGELSCE